MLSVVAGLLFTLAPAQEADAAAELQAAVGKLVQAESLEFDLLTESSSAGAQQGGPGGRGGRMTGGGGFQKAHGVWKKGQPMRLEASDQVAYKLGDKLVHQGEDGSWQVLEMGRGGRGGGRPGAGAQGGPGAGRGGQGAGGGQGGQRGGERGDRPGGQGGPGGQRGQGGPGGPGAGPMGGGRALFGLMAVEAPADLLAGFDGKVADVSKQSQDGAVVYTGTLSQAGVDSLAGRGGMPRGPRGGGDGEAPQMQMESSGTYTITVKDGAVVSAAFEVRRVGSFGERTFDRTTKRTLTFDKVGSAELEVPEEVQALLR